MITTVVIVLALLLILLWCDLIGASHRYYRLDRSTYEVEDLEIQ